MPTPESPAPTGNTRPPDPNQFVPPAVRAAAERAEQLMRENGIAPEPAPEPPQPAPEPPPAPEPQAGAPEPLPAPEPHAEPADADGWRRRYEAEHGRLERARRDLQDMGDRVADLEHMIATLNLTSVQPPQETTFEPVNLLTDQEKQEWAEMLPVVEKKAKELIAPLEAELKSKLKQLDDQLKGVGQAQVATSRSKMLQTLDANPLIGLGAGDNCWRLINDDDEFVKDWLQRVDRHSGQRRHELLKEAYDLNDASRVAAFFEDFLKEAGRSAPQPSPQPNGAAAPSAPAPGLERFAAPGSPKAAPVAPTAPAEPEIFTSGDVSRFYADKTAGKWRGREAECEAYERKLHAAVATGRIRPGPPQP